MTAQGVDAGVQFVLDNMQTIVASEGGSLEFLGLRDGRLEVRYNKGHNEECPECVPDHDTVLQMMKASLGIHVPSVTEVALL